MRLRSARVAVAEENEPPSQPTITTRQSKRRAKSRKTEKLEADQPALGDSKLLTAEPADELQDGIEGRHDGLNKPAEVLMDLHTAESPVFNAEAAAEAARMAEALLSSTPPSEQPCLDITAPAVSPLQCHHSDISLAGDEVLGSGLRLSAPQLQAA